MNELFPTPTVVWDDFAEWWKIVPRKVGKKESERCYRLARKKHDSSFLREAMIAYADKHKDKEMKFLLHPSTWLRGERWLDEEEVVKSNNVQLRPEKIWAHKVFIAKMGYTGVRSPPTVAEMKLMLERAEITREQADRWPLMRR